jgi:RNA polymerase sigma-70 factor, ECF subfamily
VPQSSDPPSARGDRRAAFEQLAMPHARALHRTAQRFTGRVEDASDLVQETFLRAYRTFDNFQTGTNEKAWLFTILYSIMSNRWRSAQRVPDEVTFDGLDERVADRVSAAGTSGEQQLLARLGATPEIHRALERLPEGYRAAVLLVDVEELTYEEASTVLACPVGTVRSRLARGRRLLFTALMDYATRTGVVRGTAS